MKKVSSSKLKLDFNKIQNKLYSAVISDILDAMGHPDHSMNYLIQPLTSESMVVGYAATILLADIYHKPKEPYDLEIDALDELQKDSVVVIAAGSSTRFAVWGELLSTGARARGARGAVCDGMVRDTRQMIEMNFPVFSMGKINLDSAGRAIAINYNCPIECGGVLVNPGDIIFGDIDGIVVIPQSIADEVISRSLEKASKENLVKKELEKGTLLREAWEKYHIF